MKICKLLLSLCTAVLLAVLPAAPALAAGGNSLTVQYPLSGVRFDLYRAAERTEGGWALTGDFAQYPVALPGTDWLGTAATLAALAARDQIVPDRSGTVSNGAASFDGLADGLYLVVGEMSTSGGFRYTPVPFLVELSGLPITASAKYDQEETGGGDDDDDGGDETLSCTVEKVWVQEEDREHPLRVTVQLLQDGTVYDTAVLSPLNGWSHTWRHLNAGHRWQVTEEAVPEGYTVSVAQAGMVFTITNTYAPEEELPEEETPLGPGEPGTPEEPGEPQEPGAEPGGPEQPGEPETDLPEPEVPGGSLPQTGQLRWPVPVLSGVGAALICAGYFLQRKRS